MNNSQLWAYARTLLTMLGTSLGAWLVNKGYLTAAQLDTISGALQQAALALVPAVPLILSFIGTWISNSRKNKILSTSNLPGVEHVVLTSAAEANAIPSDKVVSK